MKSIDVKEVFKNKERYLGCQIIMTGHVLVNNEKITISKGLQEKFNQIEILSENFEDKLLDKVPCYIGGEYIFSDKMVICGTLILDNDSFKLSEIVSAVVIRALDKYTINLE